MESLPPGGVMVAVRRPLDAVQRATRGVAGASIAAVNGPNAIVISGPAESVEEVTRQLGLSSREAMPLRVSHAFHSGLMEPILDELEQVAARMKVQDPELRWVSTLTGAPMDQPPTPGHWRRHAREPVLFGPAIEALSDLGVDVMLEIGPRPVLLPLARRVAR